MRNQTAIANWVVLTGVYSYHSNGHSYLRWHLGHNSSINKADRDYLRVDLRGQTHPTVGPLGRQRDVQHFYISPNDLGVLLE